MNSGSLKYACVWTQNSQQASGRVIFLSGIPFVFHYSHLLLTFFWDETLYLMVFIHNSAYDWLSWHHMSVFVLNPSYSRNCVTIYNHFFLHHEKKKKKVKKGLKLDKKNPTNLNTWIYHFKEKEFYGYFYNILVNHFYDAQTWNPCRHCKKLSLKQRFFWIKTYLYVEKMIQNWPHFFLLANWNWTGCSLVAGAFLQWEKHSEIIDNCVLKAKNPLDWFSFTWTIKHKLSLSRNTCIIL